MSVLGTMMLRAGLLSENQVTAANEHAANQSTSHVDAILELGLADEDTLVAFLASKLMIPRVRSAVLERVDAQTLARLPGDLAWDFRCMPVSVDELGNLTVAMTDPTDPRALAAIAEQADAYLVRAVGSASDLRRAVERHYGPEQQARQRVANATRTTVREAEQSTELALEPVRDQQAPPGIRNPAPQMAVPAVAPPVPPAAPPAAAPYMSPPETGAPDQAAPYMASAPQADINGIPDDDDDVPIHSAHGAAREINSSPIQQSVQRSLEQLDSDPHERPTMVETQTPAAARGPRRPRAHTPWNPPLQGFHTDPPPLSPEAFAQVLPLLEAAGDRDAVTTVLLDFLGAGFDRVILFVHSHNELRGLDARGKDLLVEAVRQVRIPSTGKSMFSEALERASPYLGSMQSASKIDQAFSHALGGIKGNVLLLPITLGTKVPLLLWAHGTNHGIDPRSIAELSAAVSAAIQRILSARRR